MLPHTTIRGWRMLAVASAVLCALNAQAAEGTDENIERIEITGSRIKRTDIESASPITTITFEDMQREGHTNVADVLNSMSQATGGVQGEQNSNSFTPNAQMVNLRGLGPGYTLVLVNGKRMADYPLPFNGQSNFVNLASIPTGIVERIDILAGGASSIYGSDAVAGVINIITRKDVDGLSAYLRVGDTQHGGGASQRLQVVGGHNFDRSNLTFAYEYFNTDPIYGKDRSYTDSRFDNPNPGGPVNLDYDLLMYDPQANTFIDPTEATCDKFTDLTYTVLPNGRRYCGRDGAGDETLRGQRNWHTLYGALTTPVGDSGEFNVSAIVWQSESQHDSFRAWWGSPFPFIEFDPNAGEFTGMRYLQRVWQPSETGDQSMLFEEQSVVVNVEYLATLGNYDLAFAYSHAKNDSNFQLPRFKAELINDYFLGQDLRADFGMTDFPFPIHAINYERFLNPASRADTAAMMGNAETDADSSAETWSATLSGDLFALPAGAVQFAAVLELGQQDYSIKLDDRLPPGGLDWYAMTNTGGGGERERAAAGFELIVPVTESIKLTPSLRYDNYNDDTNVDDALTYGFGIEYRPTADLLLRSNYQTSFRAPDMHYVYADVSGFYNNVIDFSSCWIAFDPNPNDDVVPAVADDVCAREIQFVPQVFGTRAGDKELKEEEGKSFTVGMVWEVTAGLSATIDYYDIDLRDSVSDEDATSLFREEAKCLTAAYAAAHSATCDRVQSVIHRYSEGPRAGQIESYETKPINTGRMRQRGIDSLISYRVETASWGTFKTTVQWTHVLETWRQLTSDAELEKDFRDDEYNPDRRSNVRATLAWNSESWDATLLGHRTGSVRKYDPSAGRTAPWMTYNLGLGYHFGQDNRVGLSVVNVTDRRAQEDSTHGAWPYYNSAHYNAFGREYFVEYTHRF